MKYSNDGKIHYKLSFKDEFKLLPVYRDSTVEIDGYARKSKRKAKEHKQYMQPIGPTKRKNYMMQILDHARLKITEAKYQHLQKLTLSIPTDYHLFYDSLPVYKIFHSMYLKYL